MTKKLKKSLYAILVALGVVLFWRGAWGLMDLYLYPQDVTLSFTISLVLGIIILIFTHHLIDELM